jgi:ATP-binding cassette subfamily C protein
LHGITGLHRFETRAFRRTFRFCLTLEDGCTPQAAIRREDPMAVRRHKVRGPWGAVLKEQIRHRLSSRRVAGVRPTGSERPRTLPALELRAALRSCSGVLAALAVITATLNVLYLTSSFFMLEVYDRVVPSRSVPTLVALAMLALALFGFHGFLDIIRTRVMIRVGSWADRALSGRVYDMIARLPLRAGRGGDGLQPLRDLDQLRTFLSGLGPTALFDLPWIPFYLALCYLFHPLIGLTALVGSIVLVSLTFLTDILTRSPIAQAAGEGASRNALAEASRRNAEVLQAMGMRSRVAALWVEANERYLESQQRAVETSGTLGALSKILRIVLQSMVLGVGGYLVIQQEASSGIIIAGTILTARALAPVELAIAHSRSLVTARQGWQRLRQLSLHLPVERQPTPLPAPRKSLIIEGISVTPPGQQRLVVQDVSLALKAGDGLGIIGVSASGKSSLVRALVGAWTPVRGKVRLDGAALDQWAAEPLGRYIGYLPQDVELFAGTVAQNISRFEVNPDSQAIVTAAEAAGVHELVLRLPQGYDTPVGEGGAALSAGQRQRIALARALYGNPFLVVLDEPNSNLDAAGDQALTRAVQSVRERGGIVVVVAHRTVALTGVDQLLFMADGRALAFGPKDLILSKVRQPRGPQQPRQPNASPAKHPTGALKASRDLH